jgi:hypothetical protein
MSCSFLEMEAVVRLDLENSAPEVRTLHRGHIQISVVPLDIIARPAAGVATANTRQCPLPAGVFGPQLTAYRYLCARCSRLRECRWPTHALQDFADMVASSPAVGFLAKSALSADATRDLVPGSAGLQEGDHR